MDVSMMRSLYIPNLNGYRDDGSSYRTDGCRLSKVEWIENEEKNIYNISYYESATVWVSSALKNINTEKAFYNASELLTFIFPMDMCQCDYVCVCVWFFI